MKKILIFLLPILIIISSCKKSFFEINANPNNATDATITSALLMSNALHVTAARNGTAYGWLNNWMGYWAPSGTYAPDVEESTYDLTSNFRTGVWSGWYDNAFDYYTMEQKADLEKSQIVKSYLKGVAKVMRSVCFQYLVDAYNNVPYKQAFQVLKYPTPAYDRGDTIYNNILRELDEATVLLTDHLATRGTTDYSELYSKDIAFNGNIAKWIQFINTFRLRLLIHQSQVPGFNPTSEIAKINANGYGFIGSGQTANVQPGYVKDNGKQNPMYNTYSNLFDGTAANDYYRANAFFLNLMTGKSDPRGQLYFKAPYLGVVYGTPANTDFSSTKTANIGTGLVGTPTSPQWLLTSVESLFLQAEAIQRNWLPGTPQTAYENAVRESFIWLGSSVGDANTYLARSGDTWCNWAAESNKITLIMRQKYNAMNGLNTMEAWTDYRRTGQPSNIPISANPSKISNVLPVRLPYPQSEYNFNSANVATQGTVNQFTSKVFWNQ
jgi:hypothetical protein